MGAKSESGLEIFILTIGRDFDKFPIRGCLIKVVYYPAPKINLNCAVKVEMFNERFLIALLKQATRLSKIHTEPFKIAAQNLSKENQRACPGEYYLEGQSEL